MALRFDPERNRYVGERLTVSVERFSDAIDELIRGGMPREDVVPVLLQEEGWSPEMEGVEALHPKDWASTLWFDFDSRRYVGTRFSVEVDAFRRRVRRLAATGAGMSMAAAHERLRHESEWSLDMPGVWPTFTAEDVIAATERLVREGTA